MSEVIYFVSTEPVQYGFVLAKTQFHYERGYRSSY